MNSDILDALDTMTDKLSAAIDAARDALEEVNPLHEVGITDDLKSRITSIQAAVAVVPERIRKDPAWRQDFDSLDQILSALQEA